MWCSLAGPTSAVTAWFRSRSLEDMEMLQNGSLEYSLDGSLLTASVAASWSVYQPAVGARASTFLSAVPAPWLVQLGVLCCDCTHPRGALSRSPAD